MSKWKRASSAKGGGAPGMLTLAVLRGADASRCLWLASSHGQEGGGKAEPGDQRLPSQLSPNRVGQPESRPRNALWRPPLPYRAQNRALRARGNILESLAPLIPNRRSSTGRIILAGHAALAITCRACREV